MSSANRSSHSEITIPSHFETPPRSSQGSQPLHLSSHQCYHHGHLYATICGANHFPAIVTWTEANIGWLNKILDMSAGVFHPTTA